MKKQAIYIFIILSCYQSFAGGGWVFEKNRGYFKVAQNMIRSQCYFDKGGAIVDIPTISLYTSSAYLEYGLSDNLDVIAYVPFFVRSTLNKVEFNQSGTSTPGDAVNSFGDTDIALKYGFFQDRKIVMSAQLIFGLPLGFSDVSAERILQTGDGEFNQMIRLDASHSFYPAPVYASVYGAFNNRIKGFSEEVRIGGEVGWTPGKWVVVMKLENRMSMFNGDADETGANGVFANNTEYFSYTPEVSYLFSEKFGLTANAGLALSGKRILAAPNFGFGVFWNL